MKQSTGFAVALAAAFALTRLGGAPAPGDAEGTAATTPMAEHGSAKQMPRNIPGKSGYTGGCTAYDPVPDSGQFPRDDNQAEAASVIQKFFGATAAQKDGLRAKTHVRYAIAMVADPHHTNLGLMFDREMVAIQQAAQDEHYTYSANWLPWPTEAQKYSSLNNQQQAAELLDEREACPGILLFRRNNTYIAEDAYDSALVVLVVSEQPTDGLNQDQWDNAVRWLADNASPLEQSQDSAGGAGRPRVLHILGPAFSGSFVSLDRELHAIYRSNSFEPASFRSTFPALSVLSGPVTGCASVQWFQRRWPDNFDAGNGPPTLFRTFQENDALAIYRFLSYLVKQDMSGSDVVVLSEDETAYGTIQHADKPGGKYTCDVIYPQPNRPVTLYYPRDISALRIAYQQQSIFSSSSPGTGNRSSHAILHGDGNPNDTGAETTDTIHAYSGATWPVAQEAVLYGIVSYLRTHHTRYVLLRCTNPFDFLFLTRFFHRAYPEARLVTVGSDLLFRREIDTTEFRGTFALSAYPLLPRNNHWSALYDEPDPPPSHVHRAFEAHTMQGWYLAARYAFDMPPFDQAHDKRSGKSLPFKDFLPDFADPYWLHDPQEVLDEPHPPTWLTVVGTDGYWPLAVLSEASTPDLRHEKLADARFGEPPPSTVARSDGEKSHYDLAKDTSRFNDRVLFKPPLAWKICSGCALLLVIYQLCGLILGRDHASAGLFSVFQHASLPLQGILLGVNSALAASIMLIFASIIFMLPGPSFLATGQWELWVCLLLSVAAIVFIPIYMVRSHRVRAAVAFVVTILLVISIAYWALSGSFGLFARGPNNLALFYRACHVTSGVSPLPPVLLMFAGFYLWTWQALAGNLMLGDGRPILPRLKKRKRSQKWNMLPAAFYRISSEMDRQLIKVASPFSFKRSVVLLPLYVGVGMWILFRNDLPLLSLESHSFAVCINYGLLGAFLLTLMEALRLFWTWQQLRRLLTALNRLRLRRTFAKLQPVEMTSLWGMSGNLHLIQYFFFSQQLDAARRLVPQLNGYFPAVEDAYKCGAEFAKMHASKLDQGPNWGGKFRRPGTNRNVLIRTVFADAVAQVIVSILMPSWKGESNSLGLETAAAKSDEAERNVLDMPLSENPVVRDAEEFVCLHYIAYIQNMLARMRTMTLSIVLLFVFVCFSISFYPFVPRTQIGFWLILNLACICASVIYVYAGMERDPTLSYMTNTKPGKLGPEFFFKLLSFLAGPLIGIVTTQFPAIADTFLGWLQPGLDAIK